MGGVVMIKTTLKLALAVAIAGLLASSAYAGPLTLSDAQMDSVVAGSGHRVAGFVCPVLKTDAPFNNPANPNDKFIQIGEGHYSILGPDVMVPIHATNTLADGTPGTPPGPHAAPGDRGYTAIWAK
jgi:hypothetical protein